MDADLGVVVAAWPRIVALVGENPATKPLITACAPIAVDGTTVTIAFPEAQAFLRERAEKRRAEIERGFDQVLGGRIVVRFVASNVVAVPPPAAEEQDGDRILAEARRIFADDIAGIADVE